MKKYFLYPLLVGLILLILGIVWNERDQVIARIDRSVASQEPTHFNILVAHFANDPNLIETRKVIACLKDKTGFKVRAHPKEIDLAKLDKDATQVKEHLLDLLADEKSEILIWGEMLRDESVKLRFQSSGGAASEKVYRLKDHDCDTDKFSRDIGQSIQAHVLFALSDIKDERNKYYVDLLRSVVEKLDHFLQMPPDLSAPAIESLKLDLADAAQILGEQSGEKEWLILSERYYRQVVNEFTVNLRNKFIARARHRLGITLIIRARKMRWQDGKPLIEESLDHLKFAALLRREFWRKEETVISLRRDWIITQNALGIAYYTFGERESDMNIVGLAIGAYEKTLTGNKQSPEQVPLPIYNSLGGAYLLLAETNNSRDDYARALKVFDKALKFIDEGKRPFISAIFKANRGIALHGLGKIDGVPRRLKDAESCFRKATRIITFEKYPFHNTVVRSDWGNLLIDSGLLNKNLGDLNQAEALLHRARAFFRKHRNAHRLHEVQIRLTRAQTIRSQMAIVGR